MLLVGFTARAQTNIAIPPQNEILKTLRKEHPRLIATKADFSSLKQRIATDEALQKWRAKVQDNATKLLTAPPSKYEIPDGLRLLSTSRRVVDRMFTLGLMYQLDGDRRWTERAWKELDAAANFPDWNPRHFLDTAEMTHGFAIGYDWFYDAWTAEQRKAIRTAMVEKGLQKALNVHHNNPRPSSTWNRVHHNWNQVCNGGITSGALAIAGEEPALASELIKAGCESIQLAMNEFAPDGAWNEGPGYWNYATMYNCAMLAELDSALGTDFGLTKIPGFDECGTFPIFNTGPTGKTFNYADASDGTIRAPHLFWLAKKFNRAEYAAYQAKVASGSPLDMVWYDKSLVKPSAAPLDKYFRAAEVVDMRSAWDDSLALFVGFKAGDNKANHSNLDLGSFVLDALGTRWFVDLGADNYNLPGYFGKARWTYYRMRAESHNTLVLNPSLDPDQDPRAATKVIRYDSKPNRAFAIADLTPAYAPHAKEVKRGVAMLDRKRVLLQDEVLAETTADLWWFAHTPAKVALDGNTATLTIGKEQLIARVLSPAGAKFEILPAAPLPASPHPDGQKENKGIEKLAIHLPATKETRIVVVFSPTGDSAKPEVIPLAKW
jgi:hypothetical protein